MGERPLLSVIVPTVGRPSLARTVRSLLQQQCWLRWEAILVGDTHAPNGGPGTWQHQLPFAREQAALHPRLSYAEHDGGCHAWGHPQRNFGATVARGKYLWWLGDDDIALPGAFHAIQEAVLKYEDDPQGGRVFLFRWLAPWKQVLWHTAGFLQQDHIDAECIVCPNVPERLGHWNERRYQGDYDMIRDTVAHWGGPEKVVWGPEVIAQAQPAEAEDWTLGPREHPMLRAQVEVRAVAVPVPLAPVLPAGVSR